MIYYIYKQVFINKDDQHKEQNVQEYIKKYTNNIRGEIKITESKPIKRANAKDTSIDKLIEKLSPDDIIYVYDLNTLGHSVYYILQRIFKVMEKKASIYLMQDDFQINQQYLNANILIIMA